MGWFTKKNKEVIDYTILAKRGLLKMPPQQTNEYKDLQVPKPEAQQDNSALGFLGMMASSAEPTTSMPASSSTSTISANKIDDIEYKLESVSKRVNAMLDRLDLLEKQTARDLRRGSL